MGSGFGALDCLTNALRVLACTILLHFAVEKAPKKIMSKSMMAICIQSSKRPRSFFIKMKLPTKHTYSVKLTYVFTFKCNLLHISLMITIGVTKKGAPKKTLFAMNK